MTLHNTRMVGNQDRTMSIAGVVVAMIGWLATVTFIWVITAPVLATVSFIIALYGIRMFVRRADPVCHDSKNS